MGALASAKSSEPFGCLSDSCFFFELFCDPMAEAGHAVQFGPFSQKYRILQYKKLLYFTNESVAQMKS